MEEFERKIQGLRVRAAERDSMRYPSAFKEDAIDLVVELRERGWTQQAISKAMEIPWATLRRWVEASEQSEELRGGFRPVTVVDTADRPALVSPSGWRLEGLTVMELVEVARRLS